MEYNVPEDILNDAIWYYENFGVVTQRHTKLGREAFRKLFIDMKATGREGIESAIDTELVFGDYDDYFGVIYNYDHFPNPDKDKLKEYVIKNRL